MSLQRDLRRIREARSLHVQQQIAREGRHPFTNNWWPKWIPWKPTQRIKAIFSRFTSSTGRIAGRVGGRKTSPRKTVSCRQNGLRGGAYGYLGARYGKLGPAAKHAKRSRLQ